MAFADILQTFPDGHTPLGAVTATQETLSGYFSDLRAARLNSFVIGRGVMRFELGNLLIDADSEDETKWDQEWELRQVTGGVQRVSITKKLATGLISMARVDARLPASITEEEANHLYRADTLVTRLQFPTAPGRVVMDSWRNPETKVSVASRTLIGSGATDEQFKQYHALHEGVFTAGSDGIPQMAEDRQHIVYGREPNLTDEEHNQLAQFMDNVELGVVKAISRSRTDVIHA